MLTPEQRAVIEAARTVPMVRPAVPVERSWDPSGADVPWWVVAVLLVLLAALVVGVAWLVVAPAPPPHAVVVTPSTYGPPGT